MSTPLIGMIGKKRSGKDTVAKTLIDRHGFKRYAFADPMRSALLDLNPYLAPVAYPGSLTTTDPVRLADYVDALGWEMAKENPEVRRLLQNYGVSVREHVQPDAWVTATTRKVAADLDEGRPVVITDVRFPNEAEAITAFGGYLVRVHRPGLLSTDTHISEVALDGYTADRDIYNDGSLAELERKVSLTFEYLFDPR